MVGAAGAVFWYGAVGLGMIGHEVRTGCNFHNIQERPMQSEANIVARATAQLDLILAAIDAKNARIVALEKQATIREQLIASLEKRLVQYEPSEPSEPPTPQASTHLRAVN